MIMHSIIHLPETNSTNTAAIELLSKKRPDEGTVIITDFQTDGRGTDLNKWESAKGMNLTFSLILYPTFSAGQQFILNKAISLGVSDFLKAELPGHMVSIKWPNDIYVGDKKACGILIQNSVVGNRLDYVVVGIGLNVNQTLFTSNAPNPVSLKMLTGKGYKTLEMLHKLVAAVTRRYNMVKPSTIQNIENDYLISLYRRMEWHRFKFQNEIVAARITGTSEFGQLLLETSNGEMLTCDTKEVSFIL